MLWSNSIAYMGKLSKYILCLASYMFRQASFSLSFTAIFNQKCQKDSSRQIIKFFKADLTQENFEASCVHSFVRVRLCASQGCPGAHLPHLMKLQWRSGLSRVDLLLLAHRLHTQPQTLAKHLGKFIHATSLAWSSHPCLLASLCVCQCASVHSASYQSYLLLESHTNIRLVTMAWT